MLQIKTWQDKSSDFTQVVTLGEYTVSIRLTWNVRSQYWMINEFEEQSSGRRLTGIKVVKSFPLFRPHKALLDPFEGSLICLRTNESVENEITYDNFGNGWDLFWMTSDEVEWWEESNGL